MVFVLFCALMLLVAIALLAKPLLQRRDGDAYSNRVSVFVFTSLSLALLAAAMYLGNTSWPWQSGAPISAPANAANAGTTIDELLKKTQAQPDNLAAWLELGRGYASNGDFALASGAFERAYALSKGQNTDAITGWAEALLLVDQSAMNGRAALLIEEALKLQPNHPKALWYGGMVALQAENLPVARDRFKALLALNPPQQVRTLLERQIQDLTQQLSEPTAESTAAAGPGAARKVSVKVSLSATLQSQLKQPVALFVLARNPKQPGPPLAVERHTSSDLPLQVELNASDAMLPSRTLAAAEEVEIVARLSASGMPTEQSGDYFGKAAYSFTRQGEQGGVTIEINQRVP